MKRLLAFFLFALLAASNGISRAETASANYLPSYDGIWVLVPNSSMEIFLPKEWSVSSPSAVPVGLIAEDRNNGISMRLSLRPSEAKSVDELCRAYAADAQYSNVQRLDVGNMAFVLLELPALDAYMGVTDVGYVQIFTFTFSPMGIPGLHALAQEIMGSLRMVPSHG